MLKRVLSALLFVVICCSACGKKDPEFKDTFSVIRERGELIVGVKTDTPPFGYLDKNGNNIGFDVDLAHYFAGKFLGDESKVKFVPVNAANRILKLASGEVDMIIATMTVNPQRQMILDFSMPYHTAGQAMMVLRGSKLTSLMELNGKKAIVVFGSTVEKNLQTNVPGVTVIGYKTYPEGIQALKNGAADAMISDDTILLGFAIKDNSLKILSKRYSKEPYAVAFRKEPESEKLMNAVNIELKEAKNNGTLRDLKQKWGFN